jgi:glycosidase
MVYNFTLPPLALHAFMTGDAGRLTQWAATLETPSDQTTYFNFMASHDGIGLRPLEGILSADEVNALAASVEAHGGLVSYKNNSDGSQSPYEMNIVYYDAVNDPEADESQARQVDRFMASQAILLSLAGVPGIYVHSLFGSRNWLEGVAESGQNRTINRRKFRRTELEASLLDQTSVPHQVFRRYEQLIRARIAEPAFHPNAAMHVLDLSPALFAFVRSAPGGEGNVLCLHNVSDEAQSFTTCLVKHGFTPDAVVTDLVGGERFGLDRTGTLNLTLQPYQVRWLRG